MGGWESTELYHNKFCTMAQQVLLQRAISLLLLYDREKNTSVTPTGFNYDEFAP